MFRYRFLLIVLFTCGVVRAASIFDDDYVQPKDTPAVRPSKPAPKGDASAPTPPPQDQPQPDPSDQDPTVIRPPSESPKEAPAQGANDAWQEALDSAQKALEKSEKAVDEILGKNSAYVSALQRAKVAEDKGIADSPAATLVQHLKESALADNATYQQNKRYLMKLTRMHESMSAQRARSTPPPTQEEFQQRITDAIAGHDLIEGMSYQEACKSARKEVHLMKKSGTEKIYHWILKGSTGTYKQVHKTFNGGSHTEDVPTYGVIGYVEGVFDDDYLVSFRRGQ